MRKRFERFCFKHRNTGIPDLMLYVSIGSLIVYVMGMMGDLAGLYEILYFNPHLILQGQVWRLVSYVFTYGYGDPNVFMVLIGLLCYYSLGRAMENVWGTLRFNLFYLSGVLLQGVFCLIFPGIANVGYLNMSLFLAYATMYPDAEFRLMFIIPIKAWILALFDLVVTFYGIFSLALVGGFPYCLFPLVALMNYFLFFGKDCMNLIPVSWKANARRVFRKSGKKPSGTASKTIPFVRAGSYQASTASVKAPHTHQCTICGRTDVSDPGLEFRYCSRCKGYHCYCQDHISTHEHIEE